MHIKDRFETDGFDCVIVSHWMGYYHGYIGIPKGHPLYCISPRQNVTLFTKGLPAVWADIANISKIDGREAVTLPIMVLLGIHGGIDYSADCLPGEEPGDLWWYGFSTGSYPDKVDVTISKEALENEPSITLEQKEEVYKYVVKMAAINSNGILRDEKFIKEELKSLSMQLYIIKDLTENKLFEVAQEG